MKNKYIRTLSTETQSSIEKELRTQGLTEEEVQDGMDSRLGDLSDTINIQKYL